MEHVENIIERMDRTAGTVDVGEGDCLLLAVWSVLLRNKSLIDIQINFGFAVIQEKIEILQFMLLQFDWLREKKTMT